VPTHARLPLTLLATREEEFVVELYAVKITFGEILSGAILRQPSGVVNATSPFLPATVLTPPATGAKFMLNGAVGLLLMFNNDVCVEDRLTLPVIALPLAVVNADTLISIYTTRRKRG
jgi:hypothetical protein